MASKQKCCWCSYLRSEARLPLKDVHADGRCHTDYTFRKRHGFDRTLEMIEAEIERELMRTASKA